MTEENTECWFVVQLIGEPDADDFAGTIVMAARLTEEAAQHECGRRSRLKDGGEFIVMTAQEYRQGFN